MAANPTLTYTVKSDQTMVTFDCSVTLATEQGAEHEVVWYVEGIVVKATNLTGVLSTDRIESTSNTFANTAAVLDSGVSINIVQFCEISLLLELSNE